MMIILLTGLNVLNDAISFYKDKFNIGKSLQADYKSTFFFALKYGIIN